MKTIGYILFFQVAASICAIMISSLPLIRDTEQRQRLDAELSYTAETAAYAALNDKKLQKQFSERAVQTRLAVWDYIESVQNRNRIDEYALLAFLCSNLGISAYLVFRSRKEGT